MSALATAICSVVLALYAVAGSATTIGTTPVSQQASPSVLRGDATWYAAPPRTAAAGPALRRFLGPGWRGSAVDVCRGGATWVTCARVRLTDWCACGGDRIIDLSDDAFSALAPLSRGVIRVEIALGAPPRETVTLPPTDTAP